MTPAWVPKRRVASSPSGVATPYPAPAKPSVTNPFHLGGLFSVFNADMVQRAELQAGGFPAEYGAAYRRS